MKTPVLAAVGHENDTLFINEVVDKYFSTPTSLGGYLRRLAEEVATQIAQNALFVDTCPTKAEASEFSCIEGFIS